jgi:proton glutamate symport protein
MNFKLSRFWKIYLYCCLAGIGFLLLGPSIGMFQPLTTNQLIMAVFVPLSFFVLGVLPFNLPTRILIALPLGTVAGFLVGPDIGVIAPLGTIFIRLIFMVIVPLVFASLAVGTQSLGDIRKMGRIGFRTVAFYTAYTIVGATIGLMLANSLQPGVGLSEEAQQALIESYSQTAEDRVATVQKPTISETLVNIVPRNIFSGMSSDPPQMLQIVFFAIFMGVALTLLQGEAKTTVVRFLDGVFQTMLVMVNNIIKIAPYAVFALIADVVGQFGLELLLLLAKYTFITLGGLVFLWATYIPLTYFTTPLRITGFIRGVWPVMGIAFSTSSSAASLPIMMDVCRKRLGVSESICNFVLPLSITINMNGTALYHGVSAVFIAQVYGIPLTLVDQIMVVMIATLAAIGGAGVPGSAFMMLVMVLTQIGVPLEGLALVLGVERILDMARTTVNIMGDSTAAVILAKTEGELDPPPELLKENS